MVKKHKYYGIEYNANFPSNLAAIATKNDCLRKWMNYIYFFKGYAWATDSYCLIRQPFNLINIGGIEHLEGKALHSIAFTKIFREKSGLVTASESGITVDCMDEDFWKNLSGSNSAENYHHEGYTYYSYSFKYSEFDEKNAVKFELALNRALESSNGTTLNYNKISFMPDLFNKLKNAMLSSGNGIIMQISADNKVPFILTDRDDALKDQIGMIMPIMLTDNIK